jgi:hypothetical protein
MNIQERAEGATKAVMAELGVSPDEAQARGVTKVIEQAIIHAMLDQSERCTHVVMEQCSPDMDMAHKLADEFRRRSQALLANLSSMR